MFQMKEQKKFRKEINKMESSNLSDIEFKTLVIRMLNKFKRKLDELNENFKDCKQIKNDIDHTIIHNTIKNR